MPIVLLTKASVTAVPPLPEDPILQAADKMQSQIRDAFLAAVQAVKDSVTLRQIAEAIQANDPGKVIELLDVGSRFTQALGGVGIAAGAESLRSALQATYGAGASAAELGLPAEIALRMSFDLLNPEAVAFLRQYTFELIEQISEDARNAIQQILLRAFETGGHPYEQAREIREVIGLTARMEQAVATYRAALESGSAIDLQAALQRALRDGRYDRSLLSALRNQSRLSRAQVDRMVERYRARYLKYRAETIARTESIRAANAGQMALWRQAAQQGLIPATARRKWIVSGDDRTCPRCMALEDVEAQLDEPFESEGDQVMGPPLHPSCRCSLALVPASLEMPRRMAA